MHCSNKLLPCSDAISAFMPCGYLCPVGISTIDVQEYEQVNVPNNTCIHYILVDYAGKGRQMIFQKSFLHFHLPWKSTPESCPCGRAKSCNAILPTLAFMLPVFHAGAEPTGTNLRRVLQSISSASSLQATSQLCFRGQALPISNVRLNPSAPLSGTAIGDCLAVFL